MQQLQPDGALSGVRILDFSQMMLGPLCTQTLADLGADVIKVERPVTGDWMRRMPMIGEFVGGDSAAFHAFNRNKRSIGVDLKNPEGRRALLRLAESFDVVVENFRSGVMDRLGLGYEDFREVNPRIIYASGSGWGSGSNLAKEGWPGQDLLVQAMSGVMFNTGRASEPPTACGTPVADFAASQSLTIGILAALVARDRRGTGQRVEANLFSSLLSVMGQELFAVLNQDIRLRRSEAGVASCWNDTPYGSFPTSDGWIVIAMCGLEQLGSLIGDPELGALDSWRDRDEAHRRISARTPLRDSAEWISILHEARIWAAPVRTAQETADELVEQESGRLVSLDHPVAGKVMAVACPVELSETPARVSRAAPQVGEHTQEILRDFLDEDSIASLEQSKAI